MVATIATYPLQILQSRFRVSFLIWRCKTLFYKGCIYCILIFNELYVHVYRICNCFFLWKIYTNYNIIMAFQIHEIHNLLL